MKYDVIFLFNGEDYLEFKMDTEFVKSDYAIVCRCESVGITSYSHLNRQDIITVNNLGELGIFLKLYDYEIIAIQKNIDMIISLFRSVFEEREKISKKIPKYIEVWDKDMRKVIIYKGKKSIKNRVYGYEIEKYHNKIFIRYIRYK